MSRRYGRKQRRAAQQQIEALEQGLSHHRLALRTAQDQRLASEGQLERLIERIKDWDSEMRAMLGPYTSFAINDTTFRVDHPDRIREMPVYPPLDLMLLGPSSEAIPETLSYHLYRVFNIITELEEDDLTTLRSYFRLQIACGTDRIGAQMYGLSEPLWKLAQRDPMARARLVRDVAERLVNGLAEQKPKRPASRPLASESWTGR